MTYDASNRKDVRRAEKESRQADRLRGDVIRAIASTTPGRAYLWGELERCHVFATSFNLDPGLMAFTEGERNAGLRLLADIMQWCPDSFLLIMQEENGRRTSREFTRSQNTDGRDQGSDSADDDLFDDGSVVIN